MHTCAAVDNTDAEAVHVHYMAVHLYPSGLLCMMAFMHVQELRTPVFLRMDVALASARSASVHAAG